MKIISYLKTILHIHWIYKFLIAIFLVTFFLLIALSRYHSTLDYRIQQNLNELQNLGYPVTFDDIDIWQENHHVIESMRINLDQIAITPEKMELLLREVEPFVLRKPIKKEQCMAMELYLQNNKQVIHKLSRSVKIGHSRYPLDWSNIRAFKTAKWSQWRLASKLLLVDAVYQTHFGDIKIATQRLIESLRIGHSLKYEPDMLTQMIRVAIYNHTIDTLEMVMSHHDLSMEESDLIAKEIKAILPLHAAHHGTLGKLCSINDFYVDIDKFAYDLGIILPGKEKTRILFNDLSGKTKKHHAAHLKLLKQMLIVTKLQPPGRQAEYQRIKNKMNQLLFRQFINRFSGLQFYSPLSDLEVENYTIANCHIAITSLAIQRYRRNNGSWPNRLQQLSPDDFVTDPLTGKSLHYKQIDGGFSVYSTGLDKIDNDAHQDTPYEPGKPGTDIVFSVIRIQ